jgi:hypothetical protein
MKLTDLIGKNLKVLAVGTSTLLVEVDGKLCIIEAYCACNSGFWYLMGYEVRGEDLTDEGRRLVAEVGGKT